MAPLNISILLLLATIPSVFAAPAISPINALLPRAEKTCAPGGKLPLDKFNLQLPSGTAANPKQPETIPGSKLSGCNGYSNPKYFFTDPKTNALVTKVPGSPGKTGCVTTENSKHCRTELREASPNSWDPKKGTNRMKVQLQVVSAGDSTVIGQVKIDDSVSKKPLLELFIDGSGNVRAGVSQTPNVSSLKFTPIGSVKIGEKFTYEIRYDQGKLSVGLNGAEFKELSTDKVGAPKSYFKCGNYNQGDKPSEVHFFAIDIQHS